VRVVQTVHSFLPLGLPGIIGGDYLAYYTAGSLVRDGLTGDLYNLDVQHAIQDTIETASGVPASQHFVLAFDNPPPVALVFSVLASLPPAASLALWTLLNVAATIGTVLLFVRPGALPVRRLAFFVLGSLLFVPSLLGLIYGQMMGIVVLLYGLTVWWLINGRDASGGATLATLGCIKPQYAMVLTLVLLMKRRMRALVAGTVVTLCLVLLSLVLVGTQGLQQYVDDLALLDPYRGSSDYLIHPEVMTNWRAVLLNVAPFLSDSLGFLLTQVLAVVTIVIALLLWRGPWAPTRWRFVGQILGTTAATLLSAYHGHIHGVALLLVPYLVWMTHQNGQSKIAPTGAVADRMGGRMRQFWLLACVTFWPPLLAFDLLGPYLLPLRGIIALWLVDCLILAMLWSWRHSARCITP